MAPKKGLSPETYVHMANDGYSKSETARILGVTVQTVAIMARRYNINFPMGYIRKEKRDALAGQAGHEA
jgi:transposase